MGTRDCDSTGARQSASRKRYDAVQIDGAPPIDMVIRGGIHGDLATATLVMRAVPSVVAARPGLRTVLDLPILHYHAATRQENRA